MAGQAEEHTDESSFPRFRRPPRRIDGGAAPHSFSLAEDYYRYHFFYALDLISEFYVFTEIIGKLVDENIKQCEHFTDCST